MFLIYSAECSLRLTCKSYQVNRMMTGNRALKEFEGLAFSERVLAFAPEKSLIRRNQRELVRIYLVNMVRVHTDCKKNYFARRLGERLSE